MTNKINLVNLVEILKRCPEGMEFDCTIFEGAKLSSISDYNGNYPIRIVTKSGIYYNLTKYGQNNDNEDAKCVIFPKGKTTWDGFVPPSKFKVGDIIQDKEGYKVEILDVNIDDECYGYISKIEKELGSISFKDQDDWKLAPNRFDITTLIPFESKVLVREYKNKIWKPAIFGHYDTLSGAYVVVGGNVYDYLIPYENNEHLRGKVNDCKEYYKTWID
jgi:hypothetical protein